MLAAALLACTHAFAPPRRPKLRLHSVRAEPEPSRLAAALKPARGPLDKEIAAVALPAMLSLAVFPVVGMVDTFFVGRMGSALSLAGQGAANAAFNFCFFVLAVVPTLTAPRVARASARGDDEAVRTTARESLWIAGAVGLCGTIALVRWPRYFLKLVLPANAPALAPAARYLRYRALGYLPALLSSTCFAAFRGLLDTATPLRISLFYNALNAVLDPILIFGCGLGVAGAALATAVAESVGCLMYLSQLSKRIGGRKLLPTFWRRPPARATVKALAAGAAAMQVRQIALNAAFGAATRSAQAMDATGVKAAAYSISQQLWLLAAVWESTSELGCRRTSTPSSRRSYGHNVASIHTGWRASPCLPSSLRRPPSCRRRWERGTKTTTIPTRRTRHGASPIGAWAGDSSRVRRSASYRSRACPLSDASRHCRRSAPPRGRRPSSPHWRNL